MPEIMCVATGVKTTFPASSDVSQLIFDALISILIYSQTNYFRLPETVLCYLDKTRVSGCGY